MRAAAVTVLALAMTLGLAAGCRSETPTLRLELADAGLIIETPDGRKQTLHLTASGALTFNGAVIGGLTRNARILIDGAPRGNVDLDGLLRFDKQPTNTRILADGTFQLDGGDELAIGPDGVATGPLLETIDHPLLGKDLAIRYQGPPAARRAVMVGFALLVTGVIKPLPPAAR